MPLACISHEHSLHHGDTEIVSDIMVSYLAAYQGRVPLCCSLRVSVSPW